MARIAGVGFETLSRSHLRSKSHWALAHPTSSVPSDHDSQIIEDTPTFPQVVFREVSAFELYLSLNAIGEGKKVKSCFALPIASHVMEDDSAKFDVGKQMSRSRRCRPRIETLERRLPLNGAWELEPGTDNDESVLVTVDPKGAGVLDDTVVVKIETSTRGGVSSKTYSRLLYGIGSNGLLEQKVTRIEWSAAGGADTFVNQTSLGSGVYDDSGPSYFVGGSGIDYFVATNDAISHLFGNDGDDKISGVGYLFGGNGDDLIVVHTPVLPFENLTTVAYGGEGDDSLWGLGGADYFFGEGGDDFLAGGGGDDYLNGGPGNDLITGDGYGKAQMGPPTTGGPQGGAGHDVLLGGTGNDRIWGGWGNDYMDGGSGDDVIEGHGGNDTILGGDGNDHLFGGWWEEAPADEATYDGDDNIDGQDGSDYLYGGYGNDVLFGGHDWYNDFLFGGAGADEFRKKLQSFGPGGIYTLDLDQIMDLTGADTITTL